MKKKFSVKWIGSKQPRKQRKYRANAPLHIRHKLMSANLKKDLKQKYAKKSIPIVKGDKVRIMKGEFKKRTGKIESVNLKKLKITMEGIQRTKKDGTKVSVYFDPSNLQIQELNLEDTKRKAVLERKIKKKEAELSEKKDANKINKKETNNQENVISKKK